MCPYKNKADKAAQMRRYRAKKPTIVAGEDFEAGSFINIIDGKAYKVKRGEN